MLRRLWEALNLFPPGRVLLLLIVAAVVSSSAIVARQIQPTPASIEIWTFTHLAADEFAWQLKDHPRRDRIQLRNLGRAMTQRLSLAIKTGEGLPDLVEVEQSEIGQYLRGPVEDIPFVDLSERLRSEGWLDRFVPSRFAKYSAHGRIYGLPHDLHPAVLVYRPDLLEALGYKPEDLTTWDAWMGAAKDFYRPGAPGTAGWRYGMVFTDVEAFDFLMLLWQRGGDVFDPAGEVIIDSDLAVDTLERFVAMFHGDPPLAGPKLSSWYEDFAALSRGQIVAYPAVDWVLATMRLEAQTFLGGKVRCMPLPAWTPGGRRTSTSGGTMMGIPKSAGDIDAAWALAKRLYVDRDALLTRFRRQTIVPALRTVFDDPAFDEPVAFFQGQPVGRLLTELAEEVPPVRGSPYSSNAFTALNAVFAEVMKQRLAPRDALARVAGELRRIIARDREAMGAAGRD